MFVFAATKKKKNSILTLSTSRFVSVESFRTKLKTRHSNGSHNNSLIHDKDFNISLHLPSLSVDGIRVSSIFTVHANLSIGTWHFEESLLCLQSEMLKSEKKKRFRKDCMSLKSTVYYYEPTLPIKFDIVCILHFRFFFFTFDLHFDCFNEITNFNKLHLKIQE